MAHAKNGKSKRQILIQLLRKRSGSDIAKMSEQLGWQKHAVRAGMTKLRKEGLEKCIFLLFSFCYLTWSFFINVHLCCIRDRLNV